MAVGNDAGRGLGRRVVLLLWHVVVVGGFLTAYLTADDSGVADFHGIAGYAVMAAVALRVAVGFIGGKFALPRPKKAGRRTLHAVAVAVLVVAVLAAAISGFPVVAGVGLHETLSDLAAALVTAHVAVVMLIFAG
jgi:cytochrome b